MNGKSTTTGATTGLLVLAALISFASSGLIHKYAGTAGVLAHLAVVTGVLFAVRRASGWISGFCERHFKVLAGLACVVLAAGFVVTHPMEDSRGPGKSSDRDEGLNLAVTRLLHGETPYYPPNPVAGPLSVLPGSITLAVPFVVAGDSAWQNLFWLPVFLVVAWRFLGDKTAAVLLLAVPMALSPSVLYEFVSGGDLITNAIFVSAFFVLAIRTWTTAASAPWMRVGACVMLGIALASRANFVLLIPPFAALVWRESGFRQALAASLVTGCVVLAITMPFYLNDPAGFTPFLSKQKLAVADSKLPSASTLLVGATALASLAATAYLLLRRGGESSSRFFRCCTLVTLTPMVCVVVIATVLNGQPDFTFMRDRFGIMYLFFAFLGWGACLSAGKTTEAASRSQQQP